MFSAVSVMKMMQVWSGDMFNVLERVSDLLLSLNQTQLMTDVVQSSFSALVVSSVHPSHHQLVFVA